jgi:hypothetical protein
VNSTVEPTFAPRADQSTRRTPVIAWSLPRPATRRAQQADLVDIVRLYGLRNWVEQSSP